MEWISLGTTTQRPEIDTDVLVFADNKIMTYTQLFALAQSKGYDKSIATWNGRSSITYPTAENEVDGLLSLALIQEWLSEVNKKPLIISMNGYATFEDAFKDYVASELNRLPDTKYPHDFAKSYHKETLNLINNFFKKF